MRLVDAAKASGADAVKFQTFRADLLATRSAEKARYQERTMAGAAESQFEMLQRLDRYTSAHAQDLRDSGKIGSYGRNLGRIASRFWKCYVIRKGYREGPHGLLIAICAALYPILSYLKARLDPPTVEYVVHGRITPGAARKGPPPGGGYDEHDRPLGVGVTRAPSPDRG